MEKWVIYTVIYAILTGFYECSKKKAVEKNFVYDVLATMSVTAFLLAALTCKNVFSAQPLAILVIFIKSAAVVTAWTISLYVVRKMTMSLYGIINLSRIIFTTMLSCLFLGEVLTIPTIVGMILVIGGLFLANRVDHKKGANGTDIKNIFLLLFSCLLHSVTSIMDKKILVYISADQMQFWFLLFMAILCVAVLSTRKEKNGFKNIKNNYWAILAGVCLVVQDKFLFAATKIPERKIAIMILIKQLCAIEAILFGKIMFKEKNIIKKLLCCILIIFGIAIVVL